MKLQLAIDLRELERLAEELETFCARHLVGRRDCAQLNLALEEVFTNIVNHAYDDGGTHAVSISMDATGDEIFGEVTDAGKPFNPLELPPPDLESDLENRPIGGLGVHFLRSVMTELHYERRAGQNCLSFRKRLSGNEEGA